MNNFSSIKMGNETSYLSTFDNPNVGVVLEMAKHMSYKDLKNLPLTNKQYASIARSPQYQELLKLKYDELITGIEYYLANLVYRIINQDYVRLRHNDFFLQLHRIDDNTVELNMNTWNKNPIPNAQAYNHIYEYVKNRYEIIILGYPDEVTPEYSEYMSIVGNIPGVKFGGNSTKLFMNEVIPAILEREIN